MKRYVVRGKTTKIVFGEVDTLKEAYEVEIELDKKQKKLRIRSSSNN